MVADHKAAVRKAAVRKAAYHKSELQKRNGISAVLQRSLEREQVERKFDQTEWILITSMNIEWHHSKIIFSRRRVASPYPSMAKTNAIQMNSPPCKVRTPFTEHHSLSIIQ